MFRPFCLALAALCLAYTLSAQNAQPSVSSIQSLIRSHQYDEALHALSAALHAQPADFKLWTLEGICYGMKGSEPYAIHAFDKALKLSPDYTPALKGKVQILYRHGDQAAIPFLKRLVAVEPSDQTAHEMLGVLYRSAGDCAKAVDEFAVSQTAIANHPSSLESYGYCLSQLERPEDAIPVFEQLVPLLPDQTYPRYDLAILLESTKKHAEAISALEPLLTPGQSDPDILSLAAQAYEANSETPRAVELMRQAIVLSPSTADYYVAFAAICFDHDSFQVGIDMINAGLRRITSDPSLYISRGLLYAQLGEFEKAEADFNKAESLGTSQAIGSYAADLTVMERNDPERALTHVRNQLKEHPESPLLHYLLAQLLMDKAPAPDSPIFNEALQSVRSALEASPDLPGARDLLASIYMHSSRYDLAAEQCRLVLQHDPNDETALYHLVISLRHTGHNDELPPLVKHLAELHENSRKQESDRKRFRLVEPGNENAPVPGTASAPAN